MLKIYARRSEELRLLPILAEFRARVIVNYPIKGRTRKVHGTNGYKVVDFPIDEEVIASEYERELAESASGMFT
jgi:hypothetical protein